MKNQPDNHINEDIAVIGMGCHFPKSRNISEYENLLHSGIDAISLPPEYRQFMKSKNFKYYGGYVEDFNKFDESLFNISLQEASYMDPQQRIMLEVVWHALKDAQYNPKSLTDNHIGVFIGVMSNEWAKITLSDLENVEIYSGTGNGHSMIANRISYVFDINGPCLSIDSACSSSLISLHLACNSLRNEECNLAIVGGVNVILTPILHVFYYKAGLLSKSGKCKSFSDSADGMVRGEGAGAVVLKKLKNAVNDKDRIYAVIKGSAVNHNGKSNGIAAPNKWAQKEVIQKALQHANIKPFQVNYIEAHGTGTQLGDSIESNALLEIFNSSEASQYPCLIGSVKSNIGHLEGAAGIAGFIKAVLSIYLNKIYPSLHCDPVNPFTKFSPYNIKVAQKMSQYPNPKKRIAGISSFGLGGTNVHVIVSNYFDKNNKINKINREHYHFSGEKYWINSVLNMNNNICEKLYLNEKNPNYKNIIQIISNIIDQKELNITLDSRFQEDLNFDSMMLIDLKNQIVKAFSINMSIQDYLSIKTVRELVEYLEVNHNEK